MVERLSTSAPACDAMAKRGTRRIRLPIWPELCCCGGMGSGRLTRAKWGRGRRSIAVPPQEPVFNSLYGGGENRLDLSQQAFSPTEPVRHYAIDAAVVARYRDEFRVALPKRYFTDGFMFEEMAFDSAVCGYFNRDLARAMALAEWGTTNLDDWFEVQYLLEDAIVRICSCWDYLFQHLSQFIDSDTAPLATRWGRDELLGMRAYDFDWVEHADNSSSLLAVPKALHAALKDVDAVRGYYSFRYHTTQDGSKNLFRHLRDTYDESAWISEIRQLFRSRTTKNLYKLRNEVVHVRSLSSTLAISDSLACGVPSTGIVSGGVAASDETWRLVSDGHKILRTAIPKLRKAIITQDLPKPKGQSRNGLHVHELNCRSCGAVTPVPCPADIRGMLFCRNCAVWIPEDEADVGETVAVNHRVFGNIAHSYLRRASEHIARES